MKFEIAGVKILFEIQNEFVDLSDNVDEIIETYIDLKQWQSSKVQIDCTVKIMPAAYLPEVGGIPVWECDTCTVKQSGDTEIRIYHDGVIKHPYAIYSFNQSHGIQIWCDERWLVKYIHTSYLFNVCALEKILIEYRRLVFHSCFVKFQGKGILFSGFSGIGKSTQGALWEKYAGASVVNGDRSVLGKDKNKWLVYGFPFSGTSGICYQQTVPLQAIVFLKQGKVNQVRKVGIMESGKLLWEQMMVNQWDITFIDIVMEMINEIIDEVPIYELTATPDEKAVQCLLEVISQD